MTLLTLLLATQLLRYPQCSRDLDCDTDEHCRDGECERITSRSVSKQALFDEGEGQSEPLWLGRIKVERADRSTSSKPGHLRWMAQQ